MNFKLYQGKAVSEDRETLAQECRLFYEKRLKLTGQGFKSWDSSPHLLQTSRSDGGLVEASPQAEAVAPREFSKLPSQIAELRSELLSLARMDNELFKNLLALNDMLEDMTMQTGASPKPVKSTSRLANGGGGKKSTSHSSASTSSNADDEDEEDLEDGDDLCWPEEIGHYTSLPPTAVLEQAANKSKNKLLSAAPTTSTRGGEGKQGGGSSDVMSGLKYMLRSRSFLLRPTFQKKNLSFPSATLNPRRRDTSPIKPFENIQENRVMTGTWHKRSSSSDGRPKKSKKQPLTVKDIQGPMSAAASSSSSSSSTLSRGHFHLPQSSRSLWQRVFVSTGSTPTSGSSGPESLPCSWGMVDSLGLMEDKSPPPTLKHIKQNSFDSGIHNSDSSEYSIKV